MQLTPTVASRPAASAQAHSTDVEPTAEGESFASLLAGPAEPAVRSKGAAAPRERQSAKPDAGRSPRSAAQAPHRADGPAGAATDASVNSEQTAMRGKAPGAGDTDLNDWLATLIQWPGTPDTPLAPGLPSAADAGTLPAGQAVNDANPASSLDQDAASGTNPTSLGFPPGSIASCIAATAGSVMDRASPSVAANPTLEARSQGSIFATRPQGTAPMATRPTAALARTRSLAALRPSAEPRGLATRSRHWSNPPTRRRPWWVRLRRPMSPRWPWPSRAHPGLRLRRVQQPTPSPCRCHRAPG